MLIEEFSQLVQNGTQAQASEIINHLISLTQLENAEGLFRQGDWKVAWEPNFQPWP